MALLHRFLRLNDQGETGIFTFIVTRSVTRDLHRDVTSKEFMYGHQRWAITFSRHEKTLGVYLVWKNPSDDMKVYVDFSITLLNRVHFSQNQNYSAKAVKFTSDAKVHGNRRFVQLGKLESEHFMDRNGEFQLEFNLSNIKSIFEEKFKINQSIFNNVAKLGKLETSYFSFDQYDWSLSVYPTGKAESQLGSPDGGAGGSMSMTIFLNRHTGFNRSCRVRFNIRVAEGIESGIRDEVSDQDGKSLGWLPMIKLTDCVHRGVFKLRVQMLSVNTISLIDIPVVPRHPVGIPLYDKDKLAWEMEADMNAETLRLRLIHKDAKNIPRNHIRYVCWSAHLIKRHPKLASKLGKLVDEDDPDGLGCAPALPDYTAKLCMDQKLYFQYFVQDDVEDGTLMDTKIPIDEIVDPSVGFLLNRTCVQVQIEWLQSTILFQATYHPFDDVTRIQSYQMRQDIQQLRLENDVLEQRLATFGLDDSTTFSDDIENLVANNESSVDNDEDFTSDDI